MKRKIVRTIFFALFGTGFAACPVSAHPSTDVDEGLAMLRQGKLEEAAGAMHRARFATPTDPRVRYDLGIVEFRKREYASAMAEWKQALSMTPDPLFRSDILHNIGNAAYRSGQYQASVDAYKTSLEMQENPLTRHNLEQAQKRLQEEAEQQKKDEQQQPGQDKKQDQKSGKDGKQGKDGKDQKSGEGDKSKDQQKNADNQQGKEGDQQGQGKDQEKRDQQNADSKSGNASDSRQTPDPNANGTEDLADKADKERQDLAMGKDEKDKKPPPEASQRAKGMTNQKLNPYLVEKILKEMEEREKEVQMRYRNDPQRKEDMDPFEDPFFMDADRLREFMEKRQGKGKKPEGDKPDW